MAAKLFGTDGIRGRVNEGAIRPENFVRFGEAIGAYLSNKTKTPKVVIGRDTRASGLMLQNAIVAGLINSGVVVSLAGITPTPAVGFLTRRFGFDVGLMITASHNPASDNGVKVFAADGFKFSSEAQAEVEALIQSDDALHVSVDDMIEPVSDPSLAKAYEEFALSVAEPNSLSGLRVVIDGANGAGFDVGPTVFKQLGAEVATRGVEPNGSNINFQCGALHPKDLAKKVVEQGAHIGLAFDGDADRIIVVNEKGDVIDGDQIMGALALELKSLGRLANSTLVATIMSNLGLEHCLKASGIELVRTAVGDKHVAEAMKTGGHSLGGEQSGHIILLDYVTTGDAVITSILLCEMLKRRKSLASEVFSVFEPVPQVLKNARYTVVDPLAAEVTQHAIADTETALSDQGRLVIRKSGTEPVVRVMVEANDADLAETYVTTLVELIEGLE